MSKIVDLPQRVLEKVVPHLLSGEVIETALFQDNKLPLEYWLIKTNQAIILYGQRPNEEPSIVAFALDDLREINYLQKSDDIQVAFYSVKNNGKALFHFEIGAAKEIETFLLNLGDLITYRVQDGHGKINVYQRALPIGDKERHLFGRGKPVKKQVVSTEKVAPKVTSNVEATVAKAEEKPQEKEAPKTEPTKELEPVQKVEPAKTLKEEVPNPEIQKVETPKAEVKTPVVETPKPVKPTVKSTPKPEKDLEKKESISLSKLQEVVLPTKSKIETKSSKKETDYGSPVFFISATIIATIVGFLALGFFKTISRIVTYFKRH